MQVIAARDNPLAWLEMRDVYGDLSTNAEFRDALASSLKALYEEGTLKVLEAYLSR